MDWFNVCGVITMVILIVMFIYLIADREKPSTWTDVDEARWQIARRNQQEREDQDPR